MRLTTKCLYQCAHCCFECGPKRIMTLETAVYWNGRREGFVVSLRGKTVASARQADPPAVHLRQHGADALLLR